MPAFVSIERRSFGFFWFERWVPNSLEIVGEILKITTKNEITEIYIPDISNIRVVQGNKINSLKIKKIPTYFERVILTTDEREYTLKSKFFRKANFKKFIEILAEVWSASVQGFEDKVTNLRQKCIGNLRRDKKLEREFHLKLVQICESVYQAFHVPIASSEIEKIAVNPDTIFYYKIDKRFYRYYRRSATKLDADSKNIQTAEDMTETVLTNLRATSERIQSYQKVLENLKKKRHQQRNRQKLANLIDDLETLQEQNSNRAFLTQTLDGEDEILTELDELISEDEDLIEKAKILKSHAESFEEVLKSQEDKVTKNDLLTAEDILKLDEKADKIELWGLRLTYQKTGESLEVDFSKSEKLILGRRAVGEAIFNTISQISREHCELIKNKNKIQIRDLNSTNGTFFGRIKTDCRTPQTLQDESVIYLGREEFKLNFIYK